MYVFVCRTPSPSKGPFVAESVLTTTAGTVHCDSLSKIVRLSQSLISVVKNCIM